MIKNNTPREVATRRLSIAHIESQIIEYNKITTNKFTINEELLQEQRKIIEEIEKKLNIKELKDWLHIKNGDFRKAGGEAIFKQYGSIEAIVKIVYPRYLWIFSSAEFFKNERNEKLFMYFVYHYHSLSSLQQFLRLSKTNIINLGGRKILEKYQNDMKYLLVSVFPEYPWKFTINMQLKYQNQNQSSISTLSFPPSDSPSISDQISPQSTTDLQPSSTIPSSSSSFSLPSSSLPYRTIQQQNTEKPGREFLCDVYRALRLQYFKEFFHVSEAKILQRGGKALLRHYGYDFEKMLRDIFPNYPWPPPLRRSYTELRDIEIQRQFMHQLGIYLHFSSPDDWLLLTKGKFKSYGGHTLLIRFYQNDYHLLLRSIYPDHDFRFSDLNQSLLRQRRVLQRISARFRFTSLDQFLKVRRFHFVSVRGGIQLLERYQHHLPTLLSTIYPTHPWNFSKLRIPSNFYFRSMENRRSFMETLFAKFELTYLDDWLQITRKHIIEAGGASLIRHYYQNDIKALLTSIYPNFPWQFSYLDLKSHFRSLENQRKFVISLQEKFEFSSPLLWIDQRKKMLASREGKYLLLKLYEGDFKRMMMTIYPDVKWPFESKISAVERHRRSMNRLFHKFHFTSLDDWLTVTKSFFNNYGGKLMLEYYDNDMKKLLTSVYPRHKWDFEKGFKFRPNRGYSRSYDYNYEILLKIQRMYNIRTIKDWYRIPLNQKDVNLRKALKMIHSDQLWNKFLFSYRSKKANQRLLFVHLLEIYSIYEMLENYRHPWINIHNLSTDIDITSLASSVNMNVNSNLYDDNILKQQNYNTLIDNNNIEEVNLKNSLEFDVFLPALNLAFEYQGQHHYDDIPSGFGLCDLYKSRDMIKYFLSHSFQINLVVVPYWWDLSPSSLQSSITSALMK